MASTGFIKSQWASDPPPTYHRHSSAPRRLVEFSELRQMLELPKGLDPDPD